MLADDDEFGLIARYFAPLARDLPGAFGLGDDAAVLAIEPGRELVVTMDTMVEGVHFLDTDPPDSIGHKLLAVNLSDLAAMGARPLACTLSAALPRAWTAARLHAFLGGFAAGLLGLQRVSCCALAGGDTVATPGRLTLTLTALGTVAAGTALRRAGGRPGDGVYVSGAIGDAALGLAVLQGHAEALSDDFAALVVERYRRPQPRTMLGQRLVGLANACMDVSDGLIADLRHLCTQSGTDAVIASERVPLSPAGCAALAADAGRLPALLGGGDDYELLFTVPPGRVGEIAALASELCVPLTAIGCLCSPQQEGEARVRVVQPDGAELLAPSAGWRHF